MKFLLLLALCASLMLAQEVEPLPASSSLAQSASEDSESTNLMNLTNSSESTDSNSTDSISNLTDSDLTDSNSTESEETDEANEANEDEEANEANEDAITCGHIGGGSRKRTHFCTGDSFVLDEEKLDTVCPDDECTDELCCVFVEPDAVVVNQKSDEPVKESGPPANELNGGTCGMITGGPRPARHVCKGHNLVFNLYAANVECGEGGCSDQRCCREMPFVPRHNCGNRRNWTPEKERYCCIVEGVGCKPLTCSHGLGFLSEDKEVCCPNHCGMCGGEGCFEAGGPACCKTLIVASSRSCNHYPAPCANYPALTPEWEMPSAAPWSGAELVPSFLPSFDFDFPPPAPFTGPFAENQPLAPSFDWPAPAPAPNAWLPTSDFNAFKLEASPAPVLKALNSACVPRRRQFTPRFPPAPAFNRNLAPFVQPTAFPRRFSTASFPTSFSTPSAVSVAYPAPYVSPAPYLAPEPFVGGFTFPEPVLPANGGLPWCDFEYPTSIGSFDW